MGGMYADANFEYTYNVSAPQKYLRLCRQGHDPQAGDYVTDISFKKGTNNDSGLKICRYNTASEYNTGQALTTSYATFAPGFVSGVYIRGAASGSVQLTTSQTIDFICTIDQEKLNDFTTIDDKWSWQYQGNSASVTGVTIKTYFIDKNNNETLMNTVGKNQVPKFSLTAAQIKNISKIRIHYDFSDTTYSSVSFSVLAISPSITGTRTADYSKIVEIETMEDWQDPTMGRLNLGYGYPTNPSLYENISNQVLVSFTEQPLYEVIE